MTLSSSSLRLPNGPEDQPDLKVDPTLFKRILTDKLFVLGSCSLGKMTVVKGKIGFRVVLPVGSSFYQWSFDAKGNCARKGFISSTSGQSPKLIDSATLIIPSGIAIRPEVSDFTELMKTFVPTTSTTEEDRFSEVTTDTGLGSSQPQASIPYIVNEVREELSPQPTADTPTPTAVAKKVEATQPVIPKIVPSKIDKILNGHDHVTGQCTYGSVALMRGYNGYRIVLAVGYNKYEWDFDTSGNLTEKGFIHDDIPGTLLQTAKHHTQLGGNFESAIDIQTLIATFFPDESTTELFSREINDPTRLRPDTPPPPDSLPPPPEPETTTTNRITDVLNVALASRVDYTPGTCSLGKAAIFRAGIEGGYTYKIRVFTEGNKETYGWNIDNNGVCTEKGYVGAGNQGSLQPKPKYPKSIEDTRFTSANVADIIGSFTPDRANNPVTTTTETPVKVINP